MDKDRKYRMPGYQQSGGEPKPPADRPRTPAPSDLPRTLGSRSVSRCAECGALLGPGTDVSGRCSGCGAALHACRQCTHFEPGRRFECAQPVPARIPDKAAHNDCPLFALRVVAERDAFPGSTKPEDARRAFDSLFKKPSP
jgi:hypothetical protein